MKRIMLAIVTVVLFALVLATGTFAKSKSAPQEKPKGSTSQKQPTVTVTITDKTGKPLKLESLSRENQARVERARSATERFLKEESGTGGAAGITVSFSGTCCPLHITIIIYY
jgi:hypothetical protein